MQLRAGYKSEENYVYVRGARQGSKVFPARFFNNVYSFVCTQFRAGYKSEENYEYVRGRGKGKYVCEMCGIRCKKPSMLKKHLRTHTDYRPYQCLHCKFSFKTKGNLTKHMKSKVSEKAF
jgi:hypothetical protein